MGTIGILLALLMPAIAPIAGYFLGKAAKEELAAGKKYFAWMQHVLFIAIAVAFLYPHKWEIYAVVPGLAAVFAYLVFRQARTPFIADALFGIAFALMADKGLFFLISALIFLYGLPTGSLFAGQKKGLYRAVGAGLLFLAFGLGAGYLL
jgi:hypothetical protein